VFVIIWYRSQAGASATMSSAVDDLGTLSNAEKLDRILAQLQTINNRLDSHNAYLSKLEQAWVDSSASTTGSLDAGNVVTSGEGGLGVVKAHKAHILLSAYIYATVPEGAIVSPNPRLVTWYQRRLGLGFTSKPTLIQIFSSPSLCCPPGRRRGRGPLFPAAVAAFSWPPSRPAGRRFVEDSPSLRIRAVRTSAPSAPSTCASRRIRSLRAVDLRIPLSAGSALCRAPSTCCQLTVRRIRRLSAAPGPPAAPAPIADLRRSARRPCARPALRRSDVPGVRRSACCQILLCLPSRCPSSPSQSPRLAGRAADLRRCCLCAGGCHCGQS
jgi:hypothetical protein